MKYIKLLCGFLGVIICLTGCRAEPLYGTWRLTDFRWNKQRSSSQEDAMSRGGYTFYKDAQLQITSEKVIVKYPFFDGKQELEKTALTWEDIDTVRTRLLVTKWEDSHLSKLTLPNSNYFKIKLPSTGENKVPRSCFQIEEELWLEQNTGMIRLKRKEETSVHSSSLEGEWCFAGMAAVRDIPRGDSGNWRKLCGATAYPL